MPPKILFFAEAVTSAHLFRPLWFAKKLAKLGYEVHLATTQIHPILKESPQLHLHYLRGGISSEVFLANIRKGKVPFTENVIRHNLEQDMELLNEIKPDYVIDDFRLSLSIATESLGVSHTTINNITWSPFFDNDSNIVPDIEIVQKLGESFGGFLFNSFKGLFEKNIIKPFNKVRKEMDLPPIESIFQLYNSGKQVGYLDVLEFAPGTELPDNHKFLGPVLFSYPSPLPEWWEQLDSNKPWVYISLGSSGRSDLIPKLVKSLKNSDYEIIVSTSGKDLELEPQENVHTSSFLPDYQVLQHCQLYIGNGGSGGAQQALAAGVPLLALPDNFDQWLYSSMLVKQKLAEVLRPSTLSEGSFKQLVEKMLQDSNYKSRMDNIVKAMSHQDPLANLMDLVGLVDLTESEKKLSA